MRCNEEPAPPALQVAELPHGVQLAYEIRGRGPRLIFIHGVMGDWRSWDAQWDRFTERFCCVRYSRRYNHPNPNRMPSPDHSAVQEAKDLRLLMRHLGWEDAILVGSSYGSFIALVLAVEHPEMCTALALSEPPMMRYAQRSASGLAAEKQFREDVIAPANDAFRRGEDVLAAQIMTGGINGQHSSAMSAAGMERRLQNIRAMKMLALSTDEFPWITPAQLAALPMPVLLMAGRQTAPIHAEIYRNVCAALPQAETVWIDHAGHATSRDNPEAFNRMVLDFLNRHVTYPTA